MLSFDGADNAVDYRRDLNMETGVASVTYRCGDTLFTRQIFVSYPDRIMAVHIAGDKPGRVSVSAQLKSPTRITSAPLREAGDGWMLERAHGH